MTQFYRPKYHWELVEWFKKRYPSDPAYKYKRMTYSQLYAIYMRIMKNRK